MPDVTLNHVIVSNGGYRASDISYDDSAFDYAADIIEQYADEDSFENAKYVLMDARQGHNKKAVRRLIRETGDGQISPGIFVIYREVTVDIPADELLDE